MGWSITLTTDRDVSESEMDKIVSELPGKMRGLGSKQEWGYSLAADVTLESPRTIRCSGSYSASSDIAEEFCKAMAQRLEHLGCKVKRGNKRN